MADTLEVEHAGFKIRYQENENKWRCWDLDIDGPQLSTVKTKISNMMAAERRITPTHAVYWSTHSAPEVILITMVAATKPDRHGNTREARQVWANNAKGERQKFAIEYLYPLDDEMKATLAQQKELADEHRALYKKISDLRESAQKRPKLAIDKLPKQED